MFDHIATTEITLINSGKVGFEFCCLNMDPALAKKPKPGVPVMVPHAVSLHRKIPSRIVIMKLKSKRLPLEAKNAQKNENQRLGFIKSL